MEVSLEQQEQGKGKIDSTFFICVMLLVLFGFIMDFSASFVFARQQWGDSLMFVKKHFIFAILGTFCMMFMGYVDYKKLQKWVFIIFVVTLVLLALTLVPGIGIKANGARRWLGIGGFRFQTSELAKYAIILFLANYYYKYKDDTVTLKKHLIIPFAFVTPMLALVVAEPNLSTTILLGLVAVAIAFAAGLSFKHLGLLFVIALAAGVALFAYKQMAHADSNYWMDRINTFMDPFKDPDGKGWQIIQSYTAFYSGGITGVGLGQGIQKLMYLPEAHNDFIFATIAEELGLLGVLGTLTVFFILIYRGIRIALKAKDLFARLLVFGIMFMISLQVLFNIGVVLGLFPVTGLSLPFVSYGGTAMISFMGFMGIVLNVSRSVEK